MKKKVAAAFLILLGISWLLRAPRLRADLPRVVADLSGSAGEYFDEAIYAHNARNRVLFGRWITDEWNPLVYNAPLTGLYYLAFRLFGVSIATVKGVNILLGCLGVILFFAIAQRLLSRRRAFALALLFSLNFYWIVYNRQGLLENFSAFAFLLSFYLFVLSLKRSGFYFLFGMAVALAALTKYLYLFFSLAALLAVLWQSLREKKWRPLLLFGAGYSAIFACWLFLIYLPFAAAFGKIGASWGVLALPRSPKEVLSNLARLPWARYLALMPLAGLVQLPFFGSFLARAFGRQVKKPKSDEILLFFWLAGGILALNALRYSPLRYHLPLVPALFLAAAYWLQGLDERPKKSWLFWSSLGVGAILFLPFLRLLVMRPSAFFLFPLPLRLTAYIGIASLLAMHLPRFVVYRKWLASFSCLVGLLLSGFLYWTQFYRHPTYNVEMAASYIRRLPPNSVVMGQEAPRLALDSSLKTIMAYEGWFNDEDPFQQHRPTHLLVLDKFGGRELLWIRNRFPDVYQGLELEKRFWIWDGTVSLYRVK